MDRLFPNLRYGGGIFSLLLSSIKLGLYVGAVFTVLTLCISINSPNLDSIGQTLLRVFSAFFAGGFVFALALQLLEPAIANLPGYRSESTDTTIAVVLALIIAAGAVVGIFTLWSSSAQTRVAPYAAHLDEYLAQPSGYDEQHFARGCQSGQLAGKVMTVDVDEKAIDDLYQQLNAEYQPQSAEEVGTVVWLKWGKESTVKGTANYSAYIQTCEVTVIDLAAKTVIAQQRFAGERPSIPSHGAANSSFFGNKPIAEIVAFIQGLPRR